MENKPEVKIEILRAENIKADVRLANNLPEFGLVIKSSTRTSPSIDTYEVMSSPFLDKVNESIEQLNPGLLDDIKKMK